MRIQIIQGDTKEIYLSIDESSKLRDNTPIVITKIVFTCKDLGIQKEFTYDETLGKYLLSFTSDETTAYKVCRTTYDITFYFSEKVTVMTEVYNGTLEILEKHNVVS